MSDKPDQAAEGRPPVNRREFLNLAWLASLGFLTLGVGGVTYLFSMPRFREGEFGGVVNIGTVADMPMVGSAPQNNPKVKLWLSNTEGGASALYKVCTHLGCLYNWNDQEDKFICPCHGSQFTENGDYIRGPAPRSLDRFVIRAIDPNTGEVLAEATDEPLDVSNLPPDAVIQVDTGKKITGASKA